MSAGTPNYETNISFGGEMHLDVIIPTYNRASMLSRTLESLLSAEPPPGLGVRITVVDNNSKDATREVVEDYARRLSDRVTYVFEGRQGRSFALNAGITSTSGDLVGMVDDDEQIDAGWYSSIHSVFAKREIDFIGGPYMPQWGAEPPEWLPMSCVGAIGWIDGGSEIVPFDASYPGILMGGNAVLTRRILNAVGLYDTRLGRSGSRLLSGEDEDMYKRLLAAGARGLYMPNLIIHHYIPPERLTKSYFRRWSFWRGVSAGLIDRVRRTPVAYLAGVPRYMLGNAARGLYGAAAGLLLRTADPSRSFGDELEVWDAAGFFYGKHFYRTGEPAKSKTDRGTHTSARLTDPDLRQDLSRSAE